MHIFESAFLKSLQFENHEETIVVHLIIVV